MEYKVLKPELFIENTKLLNKYLLWENNALTPRHICHSKSFGSKDDIEFGTSNSFWAGFNTEDNTLRIKCSSYGDMCSFNFTRKDLKKLDLLKIDKECMEYTFEFIDNLKEKGIIC